jgi:hypothetical protein
MSSHQSLTKTIITKQYTETLTEANLQERSLRYIVEAAARMKFPELSESEILSLFEQFREDAIKHGFPTVSYVLLREIHEYLALIPTMEKFK